MTNFDINLVRLQKMITNSDKMESDSSTNEPELLINEHATLVEGVESGELQIGNSCIRFGRILCFDEISVMLPQDIVACRIKEENLEFFASTNHEFCISVQRFTKDAEKDILFVKSHYAEMMAKSKQKTVWLKDEDALTSSSKAFTYLIAKHPMPEKDAYNLLALFQAEQNVILFTFSIYTAEYALWVNIALALLKTVTINET